MQVVRVWPKTKAVGFGLRKWRDITLRRKGVNVKGKKNKKKRKKK